MLYLNFIFCTFQLVIRPSVMMNIQSTNVNSPSPEGTASPCSVTISDLLLAEMEGINLEDSIPTISKGIVTGKPVLNLYRYTQICTMYFDHRFSHYVAYYCIISQMKCYILFINSSASSDHGVSSRVSNSVPSFTKELVTSGTHVK